MMTPRTFMSSMGAAVAGLCTGRASFARAASPGVVRWAELDVNPAMLDGFRAAARALADAVLRAEPGVAAYHAVSEVDDPGRVFDRMNP